MDGLLLVPEIVLDEIVAKFTDELRKLNDIGRKFDAKYEELLGETEWKAAGHDVEEAAARYRSYLPKRLPLEQFWRLLPYPRLDHSSLAKRALGRRRPFDDEGHDGYRDALIWETILEIVTTSDETIYFVTNDRRAFHADQKGNVKPSLHSHLRDDLGALGIPPDRIHVFSTLDDLNGALLLPDLPRRDDLFQPLLEGTLVGFSLIRWAAVSFPGLISRLGIEYLAPIRRGAISVKPFPLPYPRSLDVVSVDDVLQLSSENLLVSATLTAEFRIAIEGSPAQLALPETQELFGDFLVRGDNVASLGMTIEVRPEIALTLILERGTNHPLAATIDEIRHSQITFPFHPHLTSSA